MSVAQTLHPKETEARASGQGFVRAAEANEQTPSATDDILTREQALNELLSIHDEEEARRQRCLTRFHFAILTLVPLSLILGGTSTYLYFFSIKTEIIGALIVTAFFLMTAGNLLAQWHLTGWRKYTPLPNSFCSLLSDVKEEDYTPVFSSPLQQNVITAMLIYSDEPRLADALCRALEYYQKDKNLLYVRLARLLSVLPSDGMALSEAAQRTLFNSKNRKVESAAGNEKEHMLPVLQFAAKEYFARTGEPAPRPKRKWFQRKHAAPQIAKDTD